MNPIRRFLTAFIFYPLLILWFIPKEFVRAYKKANRINVTTALSFQERLGYANNLFRHELQVAMASRNRKPIDYSYLDEALKEVKKINNQKEMSDKIIEEELGVTANGQTEGRPRE